MLSIGVAVGIALRMAAQWQPFPVQFAASVTGETVTVCIDQRKLETTFAGKLGFLDRNGVRNLSVCANVRGPISVGQTFRVKPFLTNKVGGAYALAGNIVAAHFLRARSRAQCAGLQIAVWEAIEDGMAIPNFGGGHFMVRASAEALQWAAEYYRAVGEDGTALLLATGNDGGQSQMTGIGVPVHDWLDDK